MKHYSHKWISGVVLIVTAAWAWRAADGVIAVKAKTPSTETVSSDSGPGLSEEPVEKRDDSAYTGSESCRECHEHFHELWEHSWHGLAMRPFSKKFAERKLPAQTEPLVIGEYAYRFDKKTGKVHEKGPDGEQWYSIAHVMGGKYLYYFLTPLRKGRLQVLPVAYDVERAEWYDTTASMVRHAAEWEDAPLNWKERPLTFNAACFDCHVSQVSTNYDLQTDSYDTIWKEPGINCETCHGPGQAHIRVCRQAENGKVPADLKIIRIGKFSVEQNNSLCAPCHAKMRPITTNFQPGDSYFEHYDLVSLEHRDFYPDGRDLGENYTYTSWRLSPCAQSGELDCLHCHTSSGRYRFEGDQANNACMPCHAEYVQRPGEHAHHSAESTGSVCVNCHMPTTQFARMERTDHSMRSPAPAATKTFGSPNACNNCHTDNTAKWANGYVGEWWGHEYQQQIIRPGKLVQAARNGEWEHLDRILRYLRSEQREEVFAVALIRLLTGHDNERSGPVLRKVLATDSSPWVRSAAASVLNAGGGEKTIQALLSATQDENRLVRVRAAAALAGLPRFGLPEEFRESLAAATAECIDALLVRPDDWSSHYNLGNFYFARGQLDKALDSFQTAMRLQPKVIQPVVNASMVQARQGKKTEAKQLLIKALEIEPGSAEVHFNLALLVAEQGDYAEAEEHLRKALETDPGFARAAYNLAILVGRRDVQQAIELCERAAQLAPQEARFAYTQAFYQRQSGDLQGAENTLRALIERRPNYVDGYLLLGRVYIEQGKVDRAKKLYQEALELEKLAERDRSRINAAISELRDGEE